MKLLNFFYAVIGLSLIFSFNVLFFSLGFHSGFILGSELQIVEELGNAYTLDDSMKLNLTEKNVSICEAYSDLTTVKTEIKSGNQYYFINNQWIEEDTLLNNCLYGN